MKLQAEIEDQSYEVEIRIDGDKVLARIDDREYEIEVSEPEPGVFLMKNEGRITEAYASTVGNKLAGEIEISVRGTLTNVKLIDPKRLCGSGGDHSHGDGLVEIKTAMPGKIVRILSAAGTAVKKGDGIIVVEAMKMQNEMKSPKDGLVKEIRVSKTDTVNAGQILAVIE